MAHPGGRPNEFKEDYITRVDDYLDSCVDEIEDYVVTNGDKTTSYKRIVKVNLPTLEGFARFIEVSTKSLLNWEKEQPEFLRALDKIREKQKQNLMNSGLSGDYNSTIAKLILSANHGMREGTDITTNNKDLPSPIYGGKSLSGHFSN